MVVGGLLLAGGANAADLGNFPVDCSQATSLTLPLTAVTGDTFTVSPLGTCYIAVFAGSSGIAPNSGSFSSPTVFQLTQAQYVYLQLFNVPNSAFTWFSITVNAPASIPSLSEWAQLMLALMVMTALAWHFRMQQMI
jgi:hypothetical protein